MNLEFRVIDIKTRSPQMIDGVDRAIYESVASGKSPPTVIFHSWTPSVTISRNQKLGDLNLEACKKNGYEIIRMATGGRAVVHHPKNDFSYSLFVPPSHIKEKFDIDSRDPHGIYDLYCRKMADAFSGLGLPTELRNKNDLYVGGKKLNGNAQRITDEVVMQQGIIIYKMPDIKLTLSLMNPSLYDECSVNDLREIMTSIDLHKEIPREEVIKAIANSFAKGYDVIWEDLTPEETKRAQKLSGHPLIPLNHHEDSYTVRGLCWLPRGSGLGTYKGENPVEVPQNA